MSDELRARLRAGIAIYNAGEYHAAHDAWEDVWLEIKADPDRWRDERLLHGLIQYTAAIHHGEHGNWAGLRGLAESAGEYLGELPSDYRGVDVAAVRSALAEMATDPEIVERRRPPALTHDGAVLTYEDLDFEAIVTVAAVLAEEHDAYAETVVEAAIEAAGDAVGADRSDAFVGLLFDFVTRPEDREVIYHRLREHVDRRRSRIEDVDGLFESQ